MPAEDYMLTQGKHDLVYPAWLLGQLLLLWPARPWAKANQSLPIFPAKKKKSRPPARPFAHPTTLTPPDGETSGERQPKFTQLLGETSLF